MTKPILLIYSEILSRGLMHFLSQTPRWHWNISNSTLTTIGA